MAPAFTALRMLKPKKSIQIACFFIDNVPFHAKHQAPFSHPHQHTSSRR